MPMLTTATPAVGALVMSRCASTSGQRLLPSVVEPRPSVMESPSTTMDLLALSAITSTPVMTYQCCVVDAPVMLAAVTTLPDWMNEVVREPGWPLMVVAEMFPK